MQNSSPLMVTVNQTLIDADAADVDEFELDEIAAREADDEDSLATSQSSGVGSCKKKDMKKCAADEDTTNATKIRKSSRVDQMQKNI